MIPKGFFPQQDTGRLIGAIQGDQSISFQAMSKKLNQLMSIVQHDPAVQSVVGFTGGGGGGGPGGATNSASVFVSLKPRTERDVSADQVINRLRRQLAHVSGARLFLQAVQDIRVGGRQSNAQYQFTLQGDDAATVYAWGPKILAALQKEPALQDVNLDQQQNGIETDVTVNRTAAAARDLTSAQVNNTLYDAFGQRQVSTIYKAVNQYHVIMEVAPKWTQDPSSLDLVRVSTSGGTASGTQTTNLPGRQRYARPVIDDPPTSSAARNLAQNSIGATGNGGLLVRRVGQHVGGDRGAAGLGRAMGARPDAAGGQPPEPVRGDDDLVQSGAGRLAQRRAGGDAARDGVDPRAGHAARLVRRHGAGVPAIRSPASRS